MLPACQMSQCSFIIQERSCSPAQLGPPSSGPDPAAAGANEALKLLSAHIFCKKIIHPQILTNYGSSEWLGWL